MQQIIKDRLICLRVGFVFVFVDILLKTKKLYRLDVIR